MKRWLSIVLMIALGFSCQNLIQQKKEEAIKPDESNGIAEFDIQEEFHNFGNLQAGEIVSYTFVFRNKGNATLHVSEFRTDCDCVEARILEQSVAPGDNGHIVVKYNSAGEVGKQLKRISIISNAKQSEMHLFLKADIKNEIIELYS